MAGNSRLFALLVLAAVAAGIPGHAAKADPVPGNACSGAGNYTVSSGPELSGAGHLMVCSGSVWKSVVDFDATANSTLPYALNLSGDITPTALAANTNDWAPANLATAAVIRMSASAAYNLTGLTGGADGRIITLINIGINTITLMDASTSSTAANRFALNADLPLAAGHAIVIQYDSSSTVWRKIAAPGFYGWERLSQACGPTTTCSVSCSAGKNVLGGGCSFASGVLIGSTPSGNSAWACTRSTSGSLTAYAICAFVN